MIKANGGILTAFVSFSLRFRGVIIALASLLAGYGLYSFSRAKYDVFPEFAPPEVVVQTEAPGLSPEQVEVLVTQPIEYAVNGVTGVDSIRSSSIQGLSSVTITFRAGSDIYLDRQLVAERLSFVSGELPRGVQAPIMTPLTSSTGVALVVGLTSEKRSLMEVRTIADWTVKPRLLSVPGVAGVVIFGEGVKQLQVQVRPDLLIGHRLAVEDVLAAARRATAVRGAGFIENRNQRIVLQTQGQSLTADEMAKTVVLHEKGASVFLGDVARLVAAQEPPKGAGLINGQPGVVLLVEAQYGANTLQTTQKLDQALEELRPTLKAEGVTLHSDLFRPATFIDTALRNIRSSLLIGAVLVVIVLLFFLFNLRIAAISLAAIPLSLLGAVVFLERLGFSLNTMTLGGLAIATGQVVDDAVIDVENILRRLRENRRLENPRNSLRVVLDASIEVRHPVVYATFAVALVFVPVLTMSGVSGRLFAPLGIAFIIATLFSLLVALTLTSALCLALLGRRVPEKEPPLVRWLKRVYTSLLLRVERHPRTILLATALLAASGVAGISFLKTEFLPQLREGHYLLHMVTVPGTSLEESLRLGAKVTQELLTIPYISSVAQKAGRATAKGTRGTNASEFEVDLKPLQTKKAESAPSEILRVLSSFPGAIFTVNTFLTERMEETISGFKSPVVIKIFGNDLAALDAKARETAQVLEKVPGATGVQVQSPPGAPQLLIQLRKHDLARWGFDPVEVLDTVRTAYEGEKVGQIYDENRVFDVSVILDPEVRKSLDKVGALPTLSPTGAYVPLRQLAEIHEATGLFLILHEATQRVQIVTCNVAGRSITSFVAEAKRRISSGVSLAAGTYMEFTGTAEEQARSTRDILVHSLLAGVGLVLLLSIVVASYRNVLLILLNLPFALVGGVLAVLLTGVGLSLGSLVGFVTIFGITLRNSILMISHYEHLISEEGMSWGPEAAIRGASERLAPILMTALVTALGMLPLALGTGTAGREIEGPMAIVILGGLATSTALNLLVLPTLALRYGRFNSSGEGQARTDALPAA
jgi:CzcA family heavy metal efflux pump